MYFLTYTQVKLPKQNSRSCLTEKMSTTEMVNLNGEAGRTANIFRKKKKKERFNGSYEVQVPKLSSSSNANMRRLYNISMVWYTTDSTYSTIPR